MDRNEMDELPDLSFDVSMLDDENLELYASEVDAEKMLREVVKNDVTLLASSWMNQPSVGKTINNFMDDLAVCSPNPNNVKRTPKRRTVTTRTCSVADSDTESLTGESSGCSNAPSPALSQEEKGSGYIDEDLVQLSVKELNSQVKDLPKDVVERIKKRRRTLKNRGYAHSCRMKRLQEKSSLETGKENLESRNKELETGKENLESRNKELEDQVKIITTDRDNFRSQVVKYELILKRISQQLHCQQGKIMLRK